MFGAIKLGLVLCHFPFLRLTVTRFPRRANQQRVTSGHPLDPAAPATPSPTRFAVQHATQRQPAQGTAKPAARIAGPDRECNVAPRPVAHTHRKIVGDFRCALALALGRSELDRRARGRGRDFRGGSLPSPLTITNVLRPPTLTARLARTIPAARPPPTPTRRQLRTGFTAVAGLRTRRCERPLASLQQALPKPTAARRLWPNRGRTLK